MSGHPFKKHAEHKKSHDRVARILQETPPGADQRMDESAFSRAPKYARGGRLPTAGALSGEGRLQKAGK